MSVPQWHIFRKCRQCILFPLVIYFSQASYRGSVKDFVNFNAKQDAELLHKAMKGIGKLDALNSSYKYKNTA